MAEIQTTFFTGVNAGYSAKQTAINEHAQALVAVEKAMAFVKRNAGSDHNQYTTYPALVVYDPVLSCPVGGEIAVAVTTPGKLRTATDTAEKLRAELQQSSLSVSGAPEEGLATTKGLKIETTGDLAAIAKIWQDKATDVKNATMTAENPDGIYVSVAVCDWGDGHILIQGEANPRYFPTDEDKHAWENAAKEVARAVGADMGQEIAPEFRELAFSYLRAKDRANSRGESN